MQKKIFNEGKTLGGEHVLPVCLDRTTDKTKWVSEKTFVACGHTNFTEIKTSTDVYVSGKMFSPNRERQHHKEVSRIPYSKEFPLEGLHGETRKLTVMKPGKDLDTNGKKQLPAKSIQPCPAHQVLNTNAHKKSVRTLSNLRNQAILKRNMVFTKSASLRQFVDNLTD